MAARAEVVCLSHPDCALCQGRQADGLRSGWLPHVAGPDAAASILGPDPEPEAS